MNKIELMEKYLADGTMDTFDRQDILLTDDNISNFIKVALTAIVVENRYNCFTSYNGRREKIREFTSSDYVELLCDKIDTYYGKKGYTENSIYYKDSNGRSCIDFNKLRKYIDIYADKIYPSIFGEELFEKRTIADDKFFERLKSKISNKVFSKPSNECRDAVMSGEQTKVKVSSAKINGMQAYSGVGLVRKNQEDSYYIGSHPQNKDFRLVLVADGMGGHDKGEVASNIATKEFIKFFEKLLAKEFYNLNNQSIKDKIINKLVEIDKEIKANTNNGGTTLCFAIIKDKEIIVGNVGDSRGIVIEDGRLIFSTISQSIPAMFGIPEPFDRFHSSSNMIYNCLGGFSDGKPKNKIVDFDVIEMDEDKSYDVVMCSDGVSDCLSNEEIVDIVNTSDDNDIAKNLVYGALSSRPSFEKEYSNLQRKLKSGLISVSDWNRIMEAFEFGGLDFSTALKISGGKDNTTAASAHIERKGRRR